MNENKNRGILDHWLKKIKTKKKKKGAHQKKKQGTAAKKGA